MFWRSILFYHPTLHGWNNLTLVEKGTWSGRLGNPTYHVNAMRDFIDRRLSQLSGLPHTRGPPPSCKQALNPRTYMQSHTPTVVQGGRGWWQFFETILPSVETFDILYKMDICFMGGGTVGGLSRHQTWSPSWILSRVRNQVKTVRIKNFLLICIISSTSLTFIVERRWKNMHIH